MKRITKKILPFWITLSFIGFVSVIFFYLFQTRIWLGWIIGSVCWFATGLWILLHFLLLNRKVEQTPSSTLDNKALYTRVYNEIDSAISHYLKTVNRSGLFRSSALYERPWFLVCGTERSGKTQLLRGSGLTIPLRYPPDASESSDASGIMWNFGNEAVWVDVPGSLFIQQENQEWRCIIQAVKQIRTERAIDGIVLTVDAPRLLESDSVALKELAATMRARIDELISYWGIEFPVYLVITKTDCIPGFNNLFRDPAGKWHEQMLGASFSGNEQKLSAKTAFRQEFDLLSTTLGALRMHMLARERNDQARRAICRCVIHFEGMRMRIGDFIGELFRPSSYEGKPVFSGFYFTSCQIGGSSQQQSENTYAQEPRYDMSNTVADHPLNPYRMRAQWEQTPSVAPRSSRSIKSYFTFPLFREVIPSGTAMVNRTQRFTRQRFFRHYSFVSVILFVGLFIGWYIYSLGKGSIALNNTVKSQLQSITKAQKKLEDQLILLQHWEKLTYHLETQCAAGSMSAWKLDLYQIPRYYPSVKKRYFLELHKSIVLPTTHFLELAIRQYIDYSEELSGDDYNQLYRYLKAYLSISEAINGRMELIDSVGLSQQILDAVTNTILSEDKQPRLSENVESILTRNIGLYIHFLIKGEIKLIQENQNLVVDARSRLRRLPSASVLYETAMNKIKQEAPQITLNKLCNTNQAGLLSTPLTISLAYSQEGWDKYVSRGFKEVCQDPFKIDWVVGTTSEQMPDEEFDTKKLMEDLIQLYYTDAQQNWLQFLSSITMEKFGDIERCQRMIQKVADEQSELINLVRKIGMLTVVKTDNIDNLIPKALKSVVPKKLAKKIDKIDSVRSKVDSLFDDGSTTDLDKTFNSLRSFVKSERGVLGGVEGYKDKLITLATKLSNIQNQNADNTLALFNGRESDPLFTAWFFVTNELSMMNPELSEALKTVLMAPITYTGEAVSLLISKQINTLWQEDVLEYYINRLSGRFPYEDKTTEAVFDDVMNFYRPSTGVIWGFYERRLSAFVQKNNEQWEAKPMGSLTLHFDSLLFVALAKAEVIRTIFFQRDGTYRNHKITISSIRANTNRAVLTVSDKVSEFTAQSDAGNASVVQWPIQVGSQNISLRIFANDHKTVAKDYVYSGNWGVLRLFYDSQINDISQDEFLAKWRVNVQNMYMIYYTCHVRIAGSDHPFSHGIFRNYVLPTLIVTTNEEQPMVVKQF